MTYKSYEEYRLKCWAWHDQNKTRYDAEGRERPERILQEEYERWLLQNKE